ncbi:MAG TPA: hypothetical protein VNJ70_01690 [Thermoanaerobaculia bacterium]|nr:hypothetical protein [Thermoanaerobaculia bacterium]
MASDPTAVQPMPPEVPVPEQPSPEEAAAVIASVPTYLARGRDLKRWWDTAGVERRFTERFPLTRTFNEPDAGYGYFAEALVDGRPLPIMGNFQAMFYDQPKSPRANPRPAAVWMRDQMREFILHYFMRVSDFRLPAAFVPAGQQTPPLFLQPFSWCPREEETLRGFGFQQLYYKLAGSGEVGAFAREQQFAVVDLREIGPKYEWIVLRVSIFDFTFKFQPFGAEQPSLVVPLQEASYLVVTRDFITDRTAPGSGAAGRYGFGYAFIKNPTPTLFAFGPGEFDAAIELIDFAVDDSGEVNVEMVFISNRPTGVVNVSLDPIDWGFRLADLATFGLSSRLMAPFQGLLAQLPGRPGDVDPVYAYIALANLLTGGAAASQLCISRDQLDKQFLVQHFMQHYTAISGSLPTWREICDWLDAAALPEWVIRGRRFQPSG